jgi:hypothetical protein
MIFAILIFDCRLYSEYLCNVAINIAVSVRALAIDFRGSKFAIIPGDNGAP